MAYMIQIRTEDGEDCVYGGLLSRPIRYRSRLYIPKLFDAQSFLDLSKPLASSPISCSMIPSTSRQAQDPASFA
jgi:hypothetical protein